MSFPSCNNISLGHSLYTLYDCLCFLPTTRKNIMCCCISIQLYQSCYRIHSSIGLQLCLLSNILNVLSTLRYRAFNSFVFCNELLIPSSREFWSSLQCGEINMVKPKSLCISKYPLKVVQQGPGEVSPYICSFPA